MKRFDLFLGFICHLIFIWIQPAFSQVVFQTDHQCKSIEFINDQLLLTVEYNDLNVWDLKGKRVNVPIFLSEEFNDIQVHNTTISQDGSLLAVFYSLQNPTNASSRLGMLSLCNLKDSLARHFRMKSCVVNDMCFSYDNRNLYLGTLKESIRVISIGDTIAYEDQIEIPEKGIRFIAAGPMGSFLYTISERKDNIQKWSLIDHNLVYSKDIKDDITVIALSKEGHIIAVGTRQGNIHLISCIDGEILSTWQEIHNKPVEGLGFSDHDRQIYSFSSGKNIILNDVGTGEVLYKYHIDRSSIISFDLSPQDNIVALITKSKQIILDSLNGNNLHYEWTKEEINSDQKAKKTDFATKIGTEKAINTNIQGTNDFPSVIWQYPYLTNDTVSYRIIKLVATVQSLTDISSIRLVKNSKIIELNKSDFKTYYESTNNRSIAYEVELDKGNNVIALEVTNRNGSNMSSLRSVYYELPEKEDSKKKLALIIGNSDYKSTGSLKNPINDAHSMSDYLKSVGFDVITLYDANERSIMESMDEFGLRLKDYHVGLFYYAGHGLQVDGINFIIPVDVNLVTENDVEYDCVEISRILGKMEGSGCEFNIIVLDACRDNPFERRWSGRSTRTRGLAFMNAPSGSIIAYSTAPGMVASDGSGENGLYTESLLKYMKIPNLRIEDIFKRVRTEVEEKSKGKQVPWESTSLKGEFYFIKNGYVE